MTEQKIRYIVEIFRTVRESHYVMDTDTEVKKFIMDLKTTKPEVQVEVHKVTLTKGTEWKSN